MKTRMVLFLFIAFLSINVSAQKPKKHYGHTISGAVHGAKFGPAGIAGGAVLGRALDKRKERREREGKQSFVRKHILNRKKGKHHKA